VILGVRRPGRGAGGLRRAEFERAAAGRGHALVGGATQNPADPGALAADLAQGAVIPEGVRVFGGVEFGGVIPVLARAARGVRHGEGGEQGQQQELQRRRNLGVQNRPRPGARCVGFARCGGLMGHRRED
jgi:hypothetical protein